MRRLSPSPRHAATAAAVALAALVGAGPASAQPEQPAAVAQTATPIKHVIVLVGENHTFDNIYATYRPPGGQAIENLRSEGVVTVRARRARTSPAGSNGRPPTMTADGYQTDPKLVAPYKTLPRPNTTYVDPRCDGGQAMNSPDTRFPANLPNAPFQITRYVPYDEAHGAFKACDNGAYVGDPLHRFYQMNQQGNQNQDRLWVWTADTAGDSNGAAPTGNTDQGAVSMASTTSSRETHPSSTTSPATSPSPTTTTRR